MSNSRRGGLGNVVKSMFGGIGFSQSIDNILYGGLGGGVITLNGYTDKQSQLQANLGWVYAANQVISDDCSAVPLKLYKVKDDGDREEITKHELLDLYNNPNRAITSRQMWGLYFTYLNLTGETYILKLGKDGEPVKDDKTLPTALFPLPSHLCTFKLGKNTWDESTILFGTQEFPIHAVIRDINPNPENPYFGMSIVQKSAMTIDTEYHMKQWNNKLFKNGARPGVVIEVPDEMGDRAYNRLKQQFDEQSNGSENAFRRVILEAGAKISPFMLNQQDLDFLESKKFSRDEILAMFRLSPSNLGIVEDVNRANAEAQEYGYAKRVMLPRLHQFVDMWNIRVVKPIYGSDIEFGFENPVPEDVDRKLAEANAAVNKWLTIDEIRDIYGYEALPDGLGTQLYVPINQIPLAEVAMLPDEEGDTDDTQDNNGDGGGDTTDDGNDGEGKGGKLAATKNQLNPDASVDHDEDKDEPNKRKRIGDAKAADYIAKAHIYERRIVRTSRAMFNSQKADALKWLERLDTSKSLKKDWADELIDWDKYMADFSQEMEKLLGIIVAEIGQEAFDALVEGEFNGKTEAIRTYLLDTSQVMSRTINDETQKQIRATLNEGLNAGETPQQLQARVSKVFGASSTRRAWLIAQTESANAQNYGDVEAWKQTGVVEAKEWFSAGDGVVCGFCQEMDGRVLPLRETFFKQGDQASFVDDKDKTHVMNLNYREIGHPPLHPDCRCVLLPVLYQS